MTPELLTVGNIDTLSALEPCGSGCPRPVLVMEKLTVDRISQVGGGKHMRLQLRSGRHVFNAIFFSTNPESASIAEGDLVDVAFYPQINEFRGVRSAQMNLIDIRPSCRADCGWDAACHTELLEDRISPESAARLLPDRQLLATVWRYIDRFGQPELREEPLCLCRKIVRWSDRPLSMGQLLTCLDIFADVELIEARRLGKYIIIRTLENRQKRDLNESRTMQRLLAAKEY